MSVEAKSTIVFTALYTTFTSTAVQQTDMSPCHVPTCMRPYVSLRPLHNLV